MFFIDSQSRKAVYEQLTEQAQRLISTGLLAPNDPMPSVRSLSVSLGVNPNTIQRAYTELDYKGLIYSVPGKGCFVCADAGEKIKAGMMNKLSEIEALASSFAAVGIEKSVVIDAVEKGYKTEAKN